MPTSADVRIIPDNAAPFAAGELSHATVPVRTEDAPIRPFSVIIPVYNEEFGLPKTLERLLEVLRSLDVEHEVIVVNDGSTDGTARVLSEWEDVQVVHHRVNRGYGASLKTGIRQARNPLIVITDADGTYPIERIPDLLKCANFADMVVGARNGSNIQYPLIRKIPKWFLKRFAQWMVREEIPDLNSGLRVIDRRAVNRFLNILPDGFSFTTTITLAMLSNGYAVDYQSIDYHARVGKSKIKPIRDTLAFVQLILRTGMYFAPLRVFLPVACAFFVAFLAAFTYDVSVTHNLTDKTLILFVSAMQLGAFSLLADMIDKRSQT